ncbi:phosphomannomutase/phosphoglucomutase [Geminicoccaceae bacterium 1502E]|nr:phosphomannomutase/phosphoglucomutase [Geminicoccaceae bacterium 1502E]
MAEPAGPAGAAPAGHRFHPTILREYDIRGIVGDTLHAADARAIGRAFGTVALQRGGRRICVGRDGRLSSPGLAAALAGGLAEAGLEVLDIGLGPTPMLYFAVHHLQADGGIQITGSHNPPSHNGFKLMLGRAPFFAGDIQEIGRIAAEGAWAEGTGARREVAVFDAYVERLAADYHGTRPLEVVWDAGNGAAGEVMTALTARLPGRHTCLFADIDGRFPNHHPDPTEPHNLEALIEEVARRDAELGIAFDGDGDRIGVVDRQGRIVWGDQLLQILAADLLERLPGSTIIADVKASQTLFDTIERLGGKPLMWKTGHSIIKTKMAEVGAPLSGEMSGHIFYKDGFYGHDDALYVAVRLLDILGRGSRTLAQWRDAMPETFTTPETRFECPDERKFAVIEEVRRHLASEGADVDGIDGVRVRTADGWWLLRASNTQAVLVARAEAQSAEGLGRLKDELRRRLAQVGLAAPASF